MSHTSIYVSLAHVDGKHDVKELKRKLDTLPGVTSVSVNSTKNRAAIDYDTTGVTQRQIQQKLEKLGYAVECADAEQLTD